MENRQYSSYNNGTQSNGYKASIYNYPLQQPESPQSPRRRRCGCCACCCWILLAIVILLCIGAALVYFLMKPKAPKYSVQEVTVTTFNHTSDNRITSDLKFLIQAENRNKHFKFSFGEGNLIVSYEGFDIAQGPFPAFDQPHRSTIELPVVRAQGHSIILHGAAASDLKKELSTKSDVLLKLKVKTHIRVKVGSLKSWKQKVKLSCQVSISTPSKPGKVKVTSSTCKLKN